MSLLTDMLGDGNGTYDRLLLPSVAFSVSNGTPTHAGTGGAGDQPMYLLDAAATEGVRGYFMVPVDWSTVDIDLWWLNAGTGAGDVRWRLQVKELADGSVQSANLLDQFRTVTAPAQNVGDTVAGFASGLPVAATKLYTLGVLRMGADALDTLGNDAGFIAAQVRKAS